MWRLYLNNFWLLLMTIISLPFLLLRFRHGGNTSFLMYVYAVLAEKLTGIRIAIEGRENILRTPAVYVMNHQSSLDGIPLGKLRIPRVAIIGKKEVAYIPFIGWAFWLAGNVLINRADGKKAKGQLDAGVTAIVRRKVSIAIFPEGTRSKEVGFLPYKKGGFMMAIDAHVPVVPVVIQSFKHVYDKAAGKMRSGVVHVKVLPAVITEGLMHKDAQGLAERIQSQMQSTYNSLSV